MKNSFENSHVKVYWGVFLKADLVIKRCFVKKLVTNDLSKKI